MKVNDIRTSFLRFFESKSHLTLPSASLLPAEDPTLLFTSAGMVPFKAYFAGTQTPPNKRIATVQKCMRTTDLTEVGKTRRHLSLFEMLGNFSFGDYFKKEAIEFAWEYSTQVLPFDKERIWITIFHDDDEAFDLWKKHIGVPESRIVRLGRKDNFWGPAGSTGACGPCSELYLDRGPEFDPTNTCHKPGDDGDRFLEFWNLVFNQFNLNQNQVYEPLKNTGIDTGAGLERLASLVQNVDSVYDTDELKNIRDAVCKLYNIDYDSNRSNVRILTDHIRTLVFSIADGIYPSNEARGYVLRRILRRALLSGRKLGQKQPQFYKLVDTVIHLYSPFYSELNNNVPLIKNFIEHEENRFLQTLESGATKLEEILDKTKNSGTNIISGKDAFILYDTFGFPLEMTLEVAEQNNLSINTQEFDNEMNVQKQKGRQAWKGDSEQIIIHGMQPTNFIGYDTLKSKANIKHLVLNKQQVNTVSTQDITDVFYLITDATPLYAEGGGQLADIGSGKTDLATFDIIDVQKRDNVILHVCKNLKGIISTNSSVNLWVDLERRKLLASNHSATHLLNAALKITLGTHVRQTGSLVSDGYLRFDFSHPKAMGFNELEQVQQIVNNEIEKKKDTICKVLPKEEAEKLGAVMTFGEKYGDVVRVMEISDISKEFCGGTHVANTGDIQLFIIHKESGPGAGHRRIEAYSNSTALHKIVELYASIQNISTDLGLLLGTGKNTEELHTTLNTIKKEVLAYPKIDLSLGATKLSILWQNLQKVNDTLLQLEQTIKKHIKKQEEKSVVINESTIQTILQNPIIHNSKKFYIFKENNVTINDLKKISDTLRSVQSDGVFILQSFVEQTWCSVVACSKKYSEEYSINLNTTLKDIIQKHTLPYVSTISGGGKIELVQANAKVTKNSITAIEQEEVFVAFQNIITKSILS